MIELNSLLTTKRKFEKAKLIKVFSFIAALLVLFSFMAIFLFIIIKGLPKLSLNFIFGKNTARIPTISAPIFNTLTIIFFTLLIAVPIGVFTAITLTEYLKRGNKFVEIVKIATETLSGIPSIIYALFGMVFFVKFLGWGYSLKAGICTLSIMILPTIIRSTEDSIKSVPDILREASYGLGAGKLRTVSKVIIPAASKGILASVILSIGRIVGESAAVLFTAGSSLNAGPNFLNSQGATLAVSMYLLIERGGTIEYAYTAALVLLFCVVIINIFSTYIGKRFGEKYDQNI